MGRQCRYENTGVDWILIGRKRRDCVDHFDWNRDDILDVRIYLRGHCRIVRVGSDEKGIRTECDDLNRHCCFGRFDSGDGDCGLMS